ncbi:unnamed protein product, partial [Mycena citricolor]
PRATSFSTQSYHSPSSAISSNIARSGTPLYLSTSFPEYWSYPLASGPLNDRTAEGLFFRGLLDFPPLHLPFNREYLAQLAGERKCWIVASTGPFFLFQ